METHKILFESLDRAEKHFEAGEIRVAQKLVNEVSRLMRSEGKVSNKLRHRFNFMSAQSRYFNDISSFAANPKRNEIIQKVEALIAVPMDNPRKQANSIHSLQTKWQLLDQSSKPADREQWSLFKKLTDKAWEPCAQYYDELKIVKIANAKARAAIIEGLNQYTVEQSSKWPNLIELSKHLSKTFQNWQTYAPVLDDDFVKLKSAYQIARKPINDEIRSQETKNYKLKESIINKVKLIADDDTQVCIQKFKKLKFEYQDIGPAGKKNEPVLWKLLNESADQFFQADKSLVNEELKIIETLSLELNKPDCLVSQIKSQLRDLNKTRKTNEFNNLQKSIKVFEKNQAELLSAQKTKVYSEILNHLESETIVDLAINKDIQKTLVQPTYKADIDKLSETVVMMELLAGIESPSGDIAIRQKLRLEMLQNKFTGSSTDTEKLKDLIIDFINNLQSKKLNAKELKLWKRAQEPILGLAKNLP